MNELVRQLIDFSKTSDSAGWAMFFIVMAVIHNAANTIVGIFKWIAIAIKGHPKNPKCSDCEEEID